MTVENCCLWHHNSAREIKERREKNSRIFFHSSFLNKKATTCYDKFLLLPACLALVLVKKSGKEKKKKFLKGDLIRQHQLLSFD